MAVFDSVKAELDRLDAVESVEGQVALRLAEQLDAPRNGMAVSGDANTLLKTIQALRDAQTAVGDSVDDSRDETERILRAVG